MGETESHPRQASTCFADAVELVAVAFVGDRMRVGMSDLSWNNFVLCIKIATKPFQNAMSEIKSRYLYIRKVAASLGVFVDEN
jgi:hypothetical protein